jgi:Mg2+ and Co2+ transporter CorA
MNDNNIDRFREEIRKRLRETKNETSDSVIANHSKFNEELEFHLENMEGELSPEIYDLLLQTANYAYMKGIHAGLASGNEKVQHLTHLTASIKSNFDAQKRTTPTNDLQEINKTIQGLTGIIFIGMVILGIILFLR